MGEEIPHVGDKRPGYLRRALPRLFGQHPRGLPEHFQATYDRRLRQSCQYCVSKVPRQGGGHKDAGTLEIAFTRSGSSGMKRHSPLTGGLRELGIPEVMVRYRLHRPKEILRIRPGPEKLGAAILMEGRISKQT